ncbi:hypothetical protein ACWGCW_40545 [Streptomyces sp. NPDC054933]
MTLLKGDSPGNVGVLSSGTVVFGMATGRDGSVYVITRSQLRAIKNRSMKIVIGDETKVGAGLVSLADGSLVFGGGDVLNKMGPNGTLSVLAGAAGASRGAGATVPDASPAKGFRFSDQGPTPLGLTPDGSLIVSDGNVIWGLKDGELHKIYQAPEGHSKEKESLSGPWSAVDGRGTIYLSSGNQQLGHLGDVVTISQTGSTDKIRLPEKIAGVSEDPASLNLDWLTGDGKGGVFARVDGRSTEYVLHIQSEGQAELVAGNTHADKQTPNCDISQPVNAKDIPCQLPWAMSYHSGSLVLAGMESYVLEIATK